MRCFIALDLPDRFVDELVYFSQQLKRAVAGRFVPPENYHVTLAFLGSIDESDSQVAINAMHDALEALKLELPEDIELIDDYADYEHEGTVSLVSDGLGKFGRSNDATLWLGLKKWPDVMDLAEALRSRLKEAGLSFDEKDFLPHITVARRADLRHCSLGNLAFPEACEASALTLYESTLYRDRAVYKALYSIDLVELFHEWQDDIIDELYRLDEQGPSSIRDCFAD